MKASLKTISDYYKEIGEADGVVEAGIAASENAGEFAEASAKFFGKFYSKQCLGVAGSSSSGTSSGSGAGSGRGGTLELGDETIALDSARCYLQEQTVGRSTIELTAQATGTNADGETVILDFSRYAEGDQFEGDDINIDVGDPTAADFYQYIGSLDYGEVDVSGSSLSRSGFDVRHSETNESVPASFQIEC
jgi:hypothetical protein